MEEEIMWGLGENFLAAPNKSLFPLADVDTINMAPVGWDLLDPSQKKMVRSEHKMNMLVLPPLWTFSSGLSTTAFLMLNWYQSILLRNGFQFLFV